MSKLAAKDSNEKRPFKPQIYKSRGQSRSYNQRCYQNRSSRPNSRNRGQDGNNRPRQSYRDNNFQGNTKRIWKTRQKGIGIIGIMIMIEAGIGQEKRHSQGIMATIGIEVPIIVDQDQDLELVLIEIG